MRLEFGGQRNIAYERVWCIMLAMKIFLVATIVTLSACASGSVAQDRPQVTTTPLPSTSVEPVAPTLNEAASPTGGGSPEGSSPASAEVVTTTLPPVTMADDLGSDAEAQAQVASGEASLAPLQGTAEARMTATVEALAAIGPRVGGSDAEAQAADLIVAMVEAAIGAVPTVIPVPLPNGTTSHNIVATIGDGPHVLLLGAHYDSVAESVGVDDNLSGVAVLLELAGQLARATEPVPAVTFAFFGAEEVLPGHSANDHHFGSRQLALELKERSDLPAMMISVDMVGVGERLLAVTYEDTSTDAATALMAAAARSGTNVITLSRGDISDHEAFARVGVPAAFMWRPDNPAWHTPDDTEVTPELLGIDLDVLIELVALVAE